ncbi:hypothetical protein RD792_014709 [Penstemon davidsonii]|uniref:FLZ-type domain-containing protein n=1 Tax=Penstemon davidsonii TaxID=160366 RepID=A0ABR0CSG1_9LAMI|nr:hypothetical protein RD792_014709 [Penstemon davidsonii]
MFSSVIWSKKKSSFLGNSEKEGLRILIKIANGNPSNVVVKFNSKKIKPIFHYKQIINSSSNNNNHQCCSFLESCHLCHKPLSFDKEVYMYMGDLGFCSVECRDRQIYVDEMKEIEISTKKILASFRQRRRDGGGRCETSGNLLDEYRQRRQRVIFS